MITSPRACFYCDGEATARRPVQDQRECPGANLHRSCARELKRSLESLQSRAAAVCSTPNCET